MTLREKRDQHIAVFAVVYGIRPWEIDRLKVWEFNHLADQAETWVKIQNGTIGSEG